MKTQPKRDPAKSITVDGFNGILTLNFGNGTKPPMVVDLEKFSPEIRRQLEMHGAKQKLIDSAAIPASKMLGMTAEQVIEMKYSKIAETLGHLSIGEWEKPRESSDGSGTLFFRAISALYPTKSADVLKSWLEKMTKEQISALKKSKKVVEKMDELRGPIDESIDPDELFAELEEMEESESDE